MPRLVAFLLVCAVHVAVSVSAWLRVGLLADDHHMVGGAILRHRGDWTFGSMFVPGVAPTPGVTPGVALYRPFNDLAFWLEQPWFGIDPFGYHVVISAMHCTTALLWFVLVQRLSRSYAAGLATALLFVGWPGHSEALHWISVQVDVQSTCLLSAALLALDVGLASSRRGARWAGAVAAAVLAVLAIGTKESAVFVLPLAGIVCWLRTRSIGAALRWWSPTLLAAIAWLAWRAHCLGTWGSGSHYGWHLERVSLHTVADWLLTLFAPRHHIYTAPWWRPVLLVAHGALLVAALRAAYRAPSVRGIVAVGGVLFASGFVACVGLEPLDEATLENARYGYEPVLGLCAVLGVAIAALPATWRGTVLAGLVAVHANVLDQNRQSWLRASQVYARLTSDVCGIAHGSGPSGGGQPIRVIDAPGVYDGAFAWLNGVTEFRFLQAFAPPGTNLQGGVASTQEWAESLRELAAAAARGEPLTHWYTVQWNDGALAPLALDRQWPAEPWPGVRIAYARIARMHPFAGDELPVHIALATQQPLTLQAIATDGEGVWNGPAVQQAGLLAGAGALPIALQVRIPADVPPGREVAVELLVRDAAGQERSFALGKALATSR